MKEPEDYIPKTKPYAHQQENFLHSANYNLFALLDEMGTGKSKIVIDTLAFQFQKGVIDGLLVTAPKGVYRNWVGQIGEHLPDDIAYDLVVWSPEPTKKMKDAVDSLRFGDRLKIFLVNIEALSTKRGTDAVELFLRVRTALWVNDESTSCKNRKAARTKAILKLSKLAPMRRILTGSAVTQSPLDLYAQCAFLSPRLLGFDSFYAFQGRYASVQDRIVRTGGNRTRKFKEVTGYRNLGELSAKLRVFSTQVKKDEALDLPPKVYETRDVELTRAQWSAYRDMQRHAKAIVEGEAATVTIRLTQVMRLHQIACGFLHTDDGEDHSLDSGRMKALLELLEETQGKVIIWAGYRHNVKQIAHVLRARDPSSVVDYFGDTKPKDRELAIERFQEEDECRYFVGNPTTGGYGITLTAASTVVYFSNSYKLEERIQSEDRAHRIGQDKSVTYIDLIAAGTVDERIVAALRAKKEIADIVMGVEFKEWI